MKILVDYNTVFDEHKCPHCSMSFIGKDVLHEHLSVVVRGHALSCNYCQEKVQSNSAQYQCSGCRKFYKHFQTLKRHLLYECGKPPSFKCPVPDCTYRGKRKAHLVSHFHNIHAPITTQLKIPKQDIKYLVLETHDSPPPAPPPPAEPMLEDPLDLGSPTEFIEAKEEY